MNKIEKIINILVIIGGFFILAVGMYLTYYGVTNTIEFLADIFGKEKVFAVLSIPMGIYLWYTGKNIIRDMVYSTSKRGK